MKSNSETFAELAATIRAKHGPSPSHGAVSAGHLCAEIAEDLAKRLAPGGDITVIPAPPKPKRKAISKAIRFEVFKRDKFACQYCGAKAPEAVLHVDHINPVAKRGTNAMINLITSCEPCNNGKSDKTLDDSTVVEKQRKQLEDLATKRELIDMMVQWQSEMLDLADHAVTQVCEFYRKLIPGWSISEHGRSGLRGALAEFGITSVLEELTAAARKCVRIENGRATEESATIACRVFFNALKWKKDKERDPVGSELRYIRAIVKNGLELNWTDANDALDMLRAAHQAGVPMDELRSLAKDPYSWYRWRQAMQAKTIAATGAT